MVQTIEELDRYAWTGHRAVIGKADRPWMDIDAVLSEFGGTRKKAILEYRRFMRAGAMEGHDPLLTGGGEEGISSVMRKQLTWYAQHYNRRHKRTGHLFENRYKSIICEEVTYLLALVRYIHLNPIRAKMIQTMEELDRYPWSGHWVIMGKTSHPWMDIDTVLSEFGGTRKKAVLEYRRFVQEGITGGA